MRLPFDGKFKLTQGFNDPCCRDSYARFNLKGHNGLDYGLPQETPVRAPHNGRVVEASFDKKGYGNYIKIENNIEGSVLAHLSSFGVTVGDNVFEGQIVGFSGSSGNSTAPHLHWGYYPIPRDRANGFDGFIDQRPLLNSTPVSPSTAPISDQTRIPQLGNMEVQAIRSTINDLVRDRDGAIAQAQDLKKQLDESNNLYDRLKEEFAKDLTFSNPLANLLYQLAKAIG